MTWVKVWLPEHHSARKHIVFQRAAITDLLNSRILTDELNVELRKVAHTLAAVSDALDWEDAKEKSE